MCVLTYQDLTLEETNDDASESHIMNCNVFFSLFFVLYVNEWILHHSIYDYLFHFHVTEHHVGREVMLWFHFLCKTNAQRSFECEKFVSNK